MERDLIDYFIAHSNQRFDRLEDKVDELMGFRWRIYGGILILNFLISVIVTAIAALVTTRT